jgi:antitoxin CptB
MNTALRKKLVFRCKHRGTKELDFILTRFVEKTNELLDFSSAELEQLESLLDEQETALYDWLTGQLEPPTPYQSLVMQIRHTSC